MPSYFKLILLCTCTILTGADLCNNYEDKLVLSPVELIDMILKERLQNHELQVAQQVKTMKLANRSMKDNAVPVVAEPNDDENTLKRRKVWSKWGKWGDCSVSCGSGIMTRHRVCAGGRCAHGEMEMQRRLCARPPCDANAGELHDSE